MYGPDDGNQGSDSRVGTCSTGGMNEADVKILIAEVTSGKVTGGSIIGEYEPRPLGVLSADSSTLSTGDSSTIPTGSVEAPAELTFGTCHAFRVR